MSSEHTHDDESGGSSIERPSGGEVTRLMGELARLARNSPKELAQRIARLTIREQAELALRLPAAQRIELMLHSPKPMRLVRSLPDADFYLTVREVGPDDSGALLGLASAEQLQHLFDLEAWRGDRFDADRAGAWVAMFLESGEPALRRFLRHANDELLILLFQRWVRIEQLEYDDSADQHGHGHGDAGTEDGAMTPEGYHSFSPSIPEHGPAIRQVLHVFYLAEPERYGSITWNALWSVSDEVEEEALRWRQSRLEEHGFPDHDEALSIYAAPGGERLSSRIPTPRNPDGLGSSRSALMVLPEDSRLFAAIDSLPHDARERVLFELLSLANRVLVVDRADTGNPAVHRGALDKAAGYVRIALDKRGAEGVESVRGVLEEIPVIELFREGYAGAIKLQDRARKLVRGGWPAAHPDALELLDHPVRDRIEALLEPRPLYVELDEDGLNARLREFGSSNELQETAVAVEMAAALGALLVDRLGLELGQVFAEQAPGEPPICFSTLLTTLLAWHAARGELRGDPLPPDVVADFLRNFASRRTAPPEAPARALVALLEQLTRSVGLDERELSLVRGFGRYCLEKLSDECGALDPGIPIDRRVVGSLIVAADHPAPTTKKRRSDDG